MGRPERVIQHYGVKGMKWGVIRDKAVTTARETLAPSKDSVASRAAVGKAKIGGVDALSNKEIQTFIERQRLERQYTEIMGTSSLKGKAAKWLKDFMRDVAKDTFVSWLGGRGGASRSSSDSAFAYSTSGPRVIEGTTVPRRAIGS